MRTTRFAVRVAVGSIIFGVVSTVVVAWACTNWVGVIDVGQKGRGVTASAGYSWLLTHYSSASAEWTTAKAVWDTKGYQEGMYAKPEALLDPVRHPWMRAFSTAPTADLPFEYHEGRGYRGWPWPSVEAIALETRDPDRVHAPEGGATSPWPWTEHTHEARIDDGALLTGRPHPTGFVKCLLAYCAMWAVIFGVFTPAWLALGRRRFCCAVIAAIVLGGVTTVAVAWGCAYFIEFTGENLVVHTFAGRSEASRNGSVYHYVTVGADRVRVHHEGPRRDPIHPPIVCADRRGWPLPAFESTFTGHSDAVARLMHVDEIRGGIALSPLATADFDDTRVLPLHILWSGFLLDWAIYGFTLFLAFSLIALPEWLRRIHRGWRGACRECAYDLQEIDAERCPECGWGS